MKKVLSIVCAFFCTAVLTAQKEVAVVKANYKAVTYKRKEALSISNSNTNELVLLLEDSKDTKLFLLDSAFVHKKSLSTARLESDFKSFIGYSVDSKGDNYGIFFTNNNRKKFGMLSFNFENKQVKQTLLNVDFKKEKYIKAISNNGRFFIITGNKKSTQINFHEFDAEGFKSKYVVSFESFVYEDRGYTKLPLQLLATFGLASSGSLKKVDTYSPNSIEDTSKKCKLYQFEDQLIFSSDHEKEVTKTITINLNDFSSKEASYEKPKLDLTEAELTFGFKHNSFLYNGVLYQIAITSNQMKLKAKYFDTKEVFKEIVLNKKDSINFKNGPIIQEGGANLYASRVRELEKTSKFLRKASSGNIGITAFSVGDKLKITIGGYKEIRGGGAPIGGFGGVGGLAGGIAIASFGGAALSFNPAGAAYYGHKYTKSTYINCVFDANLNHVKGEPLEDVFDNISDYEESFVGVDGFLSDKARKAIAKYGRKTTTPKLKNVFYHNSNHYFSYLDKKEKNYHIIQF